ncbi:MAG: hypothetical protein A4E48_01556 [Methanosaeta sp. PtaU1.Bin060]|nr:MAG: hypothetical protein A4E48_01556 [Methanosaeta sp. PtaU1.Bin060]
MVLANSRPAMICLRCGNCCVYLDIAIIDPGSILPDGTIDPDRSMAMIFKPAGVMCPHLLFDGKTAVCTIHHLSCYRGTPCDQFEQIGPEDSVCIMSGYFRALAPMNQEHRARDQRDHQVNGDGDAAIKR